jgi:recombination protein RecA
MANGNIDALLKKYRDAIRLANEDRPKTWISLGPLSLNIAVGNSRGVKAGRIIQIVGKYSSGKSTLALDIIRQHQFDYPEAVVVYVDFERAFDKYYAQNVGVDLDRLHIVTADSTEEGFNIVEAFVKTGDIRLIIIDSIAAAKSSTENDKDYDDSMKMASSAGAITRFCNRIVPLLDNYDTLLVVLNQLRANFNTLSPEKEIPFGSKSLQYATSVTIQTTNIQNTQDETEIQAVIKKNKVGAPRHVTKFFIKYGQGIDHAQDVLTLALERGIINKSGAWFAYGDRKAQGMNKATQEFPIEEIKQKILELENDHRPGVG